MFFVCCCCCCCCCFFRVLLISPLRWVDNCCWLYFCCYCWPYFVTESCFGEFHCLSVRFASEWAKSSGKFILLQPLILASQFKWFQSLLLFLLLLLLISLLVDKKAYGSRDRQKVILLGSWSKFFLSLFYNFCFDFDGNIFDCNIDGHRNMWKDMKLKK